jgi:hypothetical protein
MAKKRAKGGKMMGTYSPLEIAVGVVVIGFIIVIVFLWRIGDQLAGINNRLEIIHEILKYKK